LLYRLSVVLNLKIFPLLIVVLFPVLQSINERVCVSYRQVVLRY